MVPELLVLAVEYQRRPRDFRLLSNPEVPLPASFDAWSAVWAVPCPLRRSSKRPRRLGSPPSRCEPRPCSCVVARYSWPKTPTITGCLGSARALIPSGSLSTITCWCGSFTRIGCRRRSASGAERSQLASTPPMRPVKDDDTRGQYDRELRARRARGRRRQRHHRRPLAGRPSLRASVRTSSPGRVPRRRLGLLGLAVMVMLAAVFAVLASHPGVRLTSHVSGGDVHRGDEPRSVKPTRPIGGSRLGAVHMGHSPYRKFVGRTSVRQLCALGQPSANKRHANGICPYLRAPGSGGRSGLTRLAGLPVQKEVKAAQHLAYGTKRSTAVSRLRLEANRRPPGGPQIETRNKQP